MNNHISCQQSPDPQQECRVACHRLSPGGCSAALPQAWDPPVLPSVQAVHQALVLMQSLLELSVFRIKSSSSSCPIPWASTTLAHSKQAGNTWGFCSLSGQAQLQNPGHQAEASELSAERGKQQHDDLVGPTMQYCGVGDSGTRRPNWIKIAQLQGI